MSFLAVFFITLSILLSTARNLCSKKISDAPFGSRKFFRLQSILFLSGGVLLLFFHSGKSLSPLTFGYSLCYGILLLSAQWFYTIAMTQGNVGICSTIYSFGFVIPTAAGVLFWKDVLKITGGIGILLVLVAILLSGVDSKSEKSSSRKKGYLAPLILAMVSSGGLGLMQKIQQSSPFPEERIPFVSMAFLFAGAVSLIASLFSPKEKKPSPKASVFFAILTGLAFSGSNLLNTSLAGMVPLTVFPPLLNSGTMVASSIVGSVLCREKLTKKDVSVLMLGILAILLIGL